MDFVRDASIFAPLTGGLRQRSVTAAGLRRDHGAIRYVQGLHVLRTTHSHSLHFSSFNGR
jgi:hypothetical protein